MSNPRTRNLLLYVFIGLMLVVIFFGISNSNQEPSTIKFTELVRRIQADDVAGIRVLGDQLVVTFRDKTTATT
ncbi:MAG: hypothetical protein K8I82_28910, partial [Anaerolineae bacterium]|nr:hypothetical protein [Anaerolineae bacterium]